MAISAGFDTSPVAGPPRTNPYLDEIDAAAQGAHAQLSPGAQEALKRAGAPIPGQAAQPTQRISSPPQNAPGGIPIGEPTAAAPTTAPIAAPARAPITPVPLSPEGQAAQGEVNRITAPDTGQHNKQNTGVSGINQIHSPWARIPLQIAEAIGTGFAPGLTSAIPGTQLHHNVLVNQAEGAVTEQQKQRADEEAAQKSAADIEHLGAESTELESRPELRQAQNELKSRGMDITQAKNQAEQERKQGELEQKIRASGYDPQTGEPLPYEQLSEQQQAVHDWRAAQAEERQATALLRKAQAENQPEMLKVAQARLQSAANTRAVAERRLNLSEAQFEMRSRGTAGGEPLPGSILTDEGKPVGTAFQQNVRPTGQERNKADMASSAHEQLADIRSIVAKRPDIFGPAAGRKTDFTVWVGSQDPDAQAFRSARTIAADHLAGTFGGRSEAALQALDSAIGHFKDNPEAITRGLDQIDKANQVFIQRGTPKTTGSNVVVNKDVDQKTKDFADEFFGGDVKKAQAEIERQRKAKAK